MKEKQVLNSSCRGWAQAKGQHCAHCCLPLAPATLIAFGHNKRTFRLPTAHKLGSDLGQPAAGVSNHQAMAPAIEVEHSCVWQLPRNQAGIDGRNGCVLCVWGCVGVCVCGGGGRGGGGCSCRSNAWGAAGVL